MGIIFLLLVLYTFETFLAKSKTFLNQGFAEKWSCKEVEKRVMISSVVSYINTMLT